MSFNTTMDIDAAQTEALQIMADAKRLLERTGLEVSLITRCPDGAKWPVENRWIESGKRAKNSCRVAGGI